jgi:hypothetical protein
VKAKELFHLGGKEMVLGDESFSAGWVAVDARRGQDEGCWEVG